MELVKIIPAADPLKMYPSCTKSVGEAPKQYNVLTPKPSAKDEEEEFMEEATLVAEPEAIHSAEEGVEEEELVGMSEEGEEEEMEMEEESTDEEEEL